MKDKFLREERQEYTDVSTVESQRNDITLEEFPEGPYGSSLLSESLGKSSPWRVDQRSAHRFDYENHELHEGKYGIILVRMFLTKRFRITCPNLNIRKNRNDILI